MVMQERYLVEQLGAPGFYHVIARYGYSQRVQQVWSSSQCLASCRLIAVPSSGRGPGTVFQYFRLVHIGLQCLSPGVSSDVVRRAERRYGGGHLAARARAAVPHLPAEGTRLRVPAGARFPFVLLLQGVESYFRVLKH